MNKQLSLGAVAAALIASSQAYAGVCPADAPILVVTGAGFSCNLGDKTFSGFTITGAPSQAVVEFATVGPNWVVSLSRDGGAFPVGTVDFSYTVTAAAPATIREGTVGIDVSTLTPAVISASTMNGFALLPSPLINSESAAVIFTPGVSSVNVLNTSRVLTNDVLTSITNTFDQQVESVPEPASLSLFGLGLAGLGLARRRSRR